MHPVHVLLAEVADAKSLRKAAEVVRARAEEWGLRAQLPRGAGAAMDRTLVLSACEGETAVKVMRALSELSGVEATSHGREPLFWVNNPEATEESFTLGDAHFGKGNTSIVAGPCSVESFDQLLPFAQQLREAGATALRAGAYKPRTSPYHFPGLGEAGLEILAEVHRQTGLAIVTELLRPEDTERVALVAQMIQIGSRNMANTALLREAGQTGRPILLKRGMAATISEFLQAAEALADAGASHILLCERGLRHFDGETRNLLDLGSVPLLKTRTHLPVVVDPSHGLGRADLIAPMMAAAVAAGADGLLVEVHPQPSASVSDAAQALSLSEFAQAVHPLAPILKAVGRRLVTASSGISTPTAFSDDSSTHPRR
ncbi:MAG: 3-deoxy-7-phosphoheptulonate synthase [Planctomycetes bacterium]|nr:3-deoxy-7-phosphoheptulonate synthase [Planctomycetota bacterium]